MINTVCALLCDIILWYMYACRDPADGTAIADVSGDEIEDGVLEMMECSENFYIMIVSFYTKDNPLP